MQTEAYSLFELNEYIRRVMALNFPDSIWVRCEIAQINRSRGHYYLELTQKGDGNQSIVARSSAVIWAKNHRKLLKNRGAELNYLLQEGMEVKLSVQVEFHEQYGLKLIIKDIDPTYTLGQLELKKRETVRRLKELNLIHKNSELPLPIVLQRIAVISSEKAAGLQDYLEHLAGNEFGYVFENQLFKAAVQGVNAESEIIRQFKYINQKKNDFDCVILIRGGGAKLDLSAFDGLELCKVIAECPLPVLTGIGHDVDESVADIVAFHSLKTPTAVADFLIQKNTQFESAIIQIGMFLNNHLIQTLNGQHILLEKLKQTLKFESEKQINRAKLMLDYIEPELKKLAKSAVEKSEKRLENYETVLHLLRPETALKRGFTITSKNGKTIKSKSEIEKGDILTTTFWDGKTDSIAQS